MWLLKSTQRHTHVHKNGGEKKKSRMKNNVIFCVFVSYVCRKQNRLEKWRRRDERVSVSPCPKEAQGRKVGEATKQTNKLWRTFTQTKGSPVLDKQKKDACVS